MRLARRETGVSPSVKYFYRPLQGGASFVDHYVISVLFLLFLRAVLYIDALWSPAGKGLTYWLSLVMSNCELCHFPIGILGQVWCLIVLIAEICPHSYFSKVLIRLGVCAG